MPVQSSYVVNLYGFQVNWEKNQYFVQLYVMICMEW